MTKPNPTQVQRYLSGVDYPCGRDQLIEHARARGADEPVLETLAALPDRTFDGPNAVSAEYARR